MNTTNSREWSPWSEGGPTAPIPDLTPSAHTMGDDLCGALDGGVEPGGGGLLARRISPDGDDVLPVACGVAAGVAAEAGADEPAPARAAAGRHCVR